VRWTAPSSGKFTVGATFTGACDASSGMTNVPAVLHVQHDGTEVHTGYLDTDGGGSSATYSFGIDAASGDTLDFIVAGADASATFPTVLLDAQVCSVAP
jgi:hypothetical protein